MAKRNSKEKNQYINSDSDSDYDNQNKKGNCKKLPVLTSKKKKSDGDRNKLAKKRQNEDEQDELERLLRAAKVPKNNGQISATNSAKKDKSNKSKRSKENIIDNTNESENDDVNSITQQNDESNLIKNDYLNSTTEQNNGLNSTTQQNNDLNSTTQQKDESNKSNDIQNLNDFIENLNQIEKNFKSEIENIHIKLINIENNLKSMNENLGNLNANVKEIELNSINNEFNLGNLNDEIQVIREIKKEVDEIKQFKVDVDEMKNDVMNIRAKTNLPKWEDDTRTNLYPGSKLTTTERRLYSASASSNTVSSFISKLFTSCFMVENVYRTSLTGYSKNHNKKQFQAFFVNELFEAVKHHKAELITKDTLKEIRGSITQKLTNLDQLFTHIINGVDLKDELIKKCKLSKSDLIDFLDFENYQKDKSLFIKLDEKIDDKKFIEEDEEEE